MSNSSERFVGFRKFRGILCLFLTGIMILTATGCAGQSVMGQKINSPVAISYVAISYLVQNQLTATTQEKNDVQDYYEAKITLSGLKDTKVEKAINDAIISTHEEIKSGNLPPYRGIKAKIPSSSELSGNSVSDSLSYNYNNVMSIVIYGYRYYLTPDKKGVIHRNTPDSYEFTQYVGITRALNYDLNTGNEIRLQDIFTDDVDYIKILNDYISKKIQSSPVQEEDYYGPEFSGAKLVAPFKGISDNQHFYLYQGGIGLILDENNPEFEFGLYPATVNINFKELPDCIAITKRFYNEEQSLFTSKAPVVKEFMQGWSGNDVVEEASSQIGHIMVFNSARYPKAIPAQAISKIKKLSVLDQTKIVELDAAFVDNGQGNSSFEQNVWATQAGPYTSVQRNTNYYYNSGSWESQTESFIFDAAGMEVGLKDLFVPGFDYKKPILNALTQSIAQMNLKSPYTAEQLYEGAQYGLGVSEIYLYTKPVKTDVNSTTPIYGLVLFKDLGSENMTIFQD